MAAPRRKGKKVPVFQRVSNQAKAMIAMGGVLSVAFGGWFFLEGRFEAKGAYEPAYEQVKVKHKEDVADIEQQMAGYNLRFELKATADAIRYSRNEIADLQKLFGATCGKMEGRCEQLREDIRDLKQHQNNLKQELLRRRAK